MHFLKEMMKYSSPTTPSVLFILLLLLSYQQHLSTASENDPSKAYIVYMGDRKHSEPSLVVDSHHTILAKVLGVSKEDAADSIIYSYKHGFSGFAARLTNFQAKMIAEMPHVVSVIPNGLAKLHTTRSWDYLGLSLPHATTTNHLHHATTTNNLLTKSNMGEGIIVGVIDTGIWPESKSFRDDGLGPIPSRWKGACEGGQHFNSTHCNRKLIGARWFYNGIESFRNAKVNTTVVTDYLSPRDVNGHGTHTSSTAAGSLVYNAGYKGLGLGTARGGAPRARLAMYKIGWNFPEVAGASNIDLLKAFDEAIHDGVDLLSLSIGLESSYVLDVVAVGSFHAVAKGIAVVCSAGNEGPRPGTVLNPAPWIVTVAASTMDRSFFSTITLGNNQTVVGEATFIGHEIGFTSFICPGGQDPAVPETCTCENINHNDTRMRGKVVLCFASVTNFNIFDTNTAIENIQSAGAVGFIVSSYPSSITFTFYDLPCIRVDYEVGGQLLSYIRSSRAPVVKLSPSKTIVSKSLSIKLADFSSRGPSSLTPEILKPDVAAPGVNVLAAYIPQEIGDPVDDLYFFETGTSMACPIVSGIVALLKSLHPSWSPAAIKSALTTTASTTDPSGEPIFTSEEPGKVANPFHYGGGIVNPNGAGDPGLIYDMEMIDYVPYLCALGYNNSIISNIYTHHSTVCPSKKLSMLNLNLPSITVTNLRGSVTLTRTVTNVGPVSSTYIASIKYPYGVKVVVKPRMLVFNSTVKKLSFTVTLSSTHKVNGGYYFGSLSWSDGIHMVTSPISVKTEIIP